MIYLKLLIIVKVCDQINYFFGIINTEISKQVRFRNSDANIFQLNEFREKNGNYLNRIVNKITCFACVAFKYVG